MKKIVLKMFFVAVLSSYAAPLFAQLDHATSPHGFAIEVSMENTDLKRLPIYQNSISSLKVIGDYIIGGTSAKEGLSPYIFVASISQRKVIDFQDLNKVVSGQISIPTGFFQGKNNVLFAGTMADHNLSKSGDGHLIQVKIDSKGAIGIKDLAVPVRGEGVFSLVGNAKGTMLYGITYPSGTFFSYNIESGQTRTFKDIVPTHKQLDTLKDYILKPDDYIGKALIQGDNGLIYGSLPINKLFFFNPKDESFHVLNNSLPAVAGREALGQIDSWAKSKDGKIFGGNAGDGQLFEINPVTNEVRNLGKPVMMNRIRGLVFGNGKLYGIAGAPPGYTHLFSYDSKNGFYDLGTPQFTLVAPGIEQGIHWRAYNVSSITASEDGRYIVMGEDEALSQLLVYDISKNKR